MGTLHIHVHRTRDDETKHDPKNGQFTGGGGNKHGGASGAGVTLGGSKKTQKSRTKLMESLAAGGHSRPYAVHHAGGHKSTFYTEEQAQNAFNSLQNPRDPKMKAMRIEKGAHKVS